MKDSNEAVLDWEQYYMEDVPKHIEEHGVFEIEKMFKAKLEGWKHAKINIGVTGDSGVGKSSFINAIRSLTDDDEGAAETGSIETTTGPAVYRHPTNDKIKFWDLPGIGTPNYPDLETYCNKVDLEKYDTFLILAAGRFTENDLLLGKKVKSMKKSFFFVRTKIDQDVQSEKRKKRFNKEAMLSGIRVNCLEHLKCVGANDKNVFLISNHEPATLDFVSLEKAIQDVLPLHQKESLTLSLDLLTTHSKDLLKRKVKILRGRTWMVAATSAAGVLVPQSTTMPIEIDFDRLIEELNLYKSQLGLPKEDSPEFCRMKLETQRKLLNFCFTSSMNLATFVETYWSASLVGEGARYVPFVGSVTAASISFVSTLFFLRHCLEELEKTALDYLDEVTTNVAKDMDLD